MEKSDLTSGEMFLLPSELEKGQDIPIPPEEIFINKSDVYNTRYIKSEDLPSDVSTFSMKLAATLAHFRSEKV